METEKRSDIVQVFLNLLQECKDTYEKQRKEVNNMDRLKGDIEHKFEMKDLNDAEIAELGREMQRCLWMRRKHKDLAEELEPVKKLMDEYPKLLKNLTTLYNDLRYVEKQHQSRYYKPRILGTTDEKWVSENNDKMDAIAISQDEINTNGINEEIAKALAPLMESHRDDGVQETAVSYENEEDYFEDKYCDLREKYPDLMKVKFKNKDAVEPQLANKTGEIKNFLIDLCGDRVNFDINTIDTLKHAVQKTYANLISSYDNETNTFDYSKTPTLETLWYILDKQHGLDMLIMAKLLKKYVEKG